MIESVLRHLKHLRSFEVPRRRLLDVGLEVRVGIAVAVVVAVETVWAGAEIKRGNHR